MTPLGVTIISPSYRKLGREAVKRFKKFTGLEVKVIQCANEDGYYTKLRLDQLCGKKRVIFFDSDHWLLRPLTWNSINFGVFSAAPDWGVLHPKAFPKEDCERLGMRKDLYFNSGFFAADFSNPSHRALFKEARKLWRQHQRKKFTGDPGEQTVLNLARHRTNIPISMLPTVVNYYRHSTDQGVYQDIPAEVIGLHAAGVPLKKKLRHLQVGAEWLTYPPIIVQEAAMRLSWAKNQLR
jgi:hypothetical protein